MRNRDLEEAERIEAILDDHHARTRPLPGIQPPARRRAFMEQLFESIHRVQYVERGVLLKRGEPRDLDARRADPASDLFDPIKAAAIRRRQGEHDEACWLVFLFTHFGKHLRTGHRLTRNVFGSLGSGQNWTWARVSSNPEAFRTWLRANQTALKSGANQGYFGNHRKYTSLNPDIASGTGQAFVTYARWVSTHRNHRGLFDDAEARAQHDLRRSFDLLYRSMKREVDSFSRTAVFDYLTMIAKLELADIEPGSPYLTDATGPLAGARLLFGDAEEAVAPATLDGWLVELEAHLDLRMGMQILEDSLCNWQKSPDAFVAFRG
jgi:hypothetical protein